MFVALDKMRHQGVRKTIVTVPETSIGASFSSTNLVEAGFTEDWVVENRWNLCLVDEAKEDFKAKIFSDFLSDETAEVLVCPHATFRNGYERVEDDTGLEAFDDVFLAIDEFHHVSASDKNRLGYILRKLVNRGKCHVMAMTGSYFRGDSDPVLRPEDEGIFKTITYTYYEQMEGYEHLKALGVNYQFYKGNYINGLVDVLDTGKKTIVHIPHRGSSEAFDSKYNEVGRIVGIIGERIGKEEETGFDLVRTRDGKVLKIADLVDEGPGRDLVKSSLAKERRGPDGRRDDVADRAKVDVIIALGMAKEGFDWVWCEHALTIGYRSSLVEIVQIIGRATRDAPGKPKAVFTNLVAEPGVETDAVTDAVNDMLKAISGSLLMEQVLAPNFKFYRREDGDIREPVSEDGDGNILIGIKGLKEPPSERVRDICENDMQDLVAQTCQAMDKRAINPDTAPEVVTQMLMADIVEKRYEALTEDEVESVRQHLAARMNVLALARKEAPTNGIESSGSENSERSPNTILTMVKKFINVREIDIDLIDSVNAFRERFEVASKSMDARILGNVQSAMVAMRTDVTEDEARTLWPRIKAFRAMEGREPSLNSEIPLERRMAEALSWLKARKAKMIREGKI